MTANTNKQILITGGMGLMGLHIAHYAHQLGHTITLLDLPKVLNATDPPFPALSGSVCDILSVQKAMRGQDIIIHCAGNPNLWARSSHDLYQVNTQGTLNVLKAMQPGQRLIHLSSDCTLVSHQQSMIQENVQTTLKDMPGHYCKSKWLAEQAVLKASQQGMDALVINPGVPISVNLQKAPFTQLLYAFLSRQIKGYMQGNMTWVDVDDIAKCVMRACEVGQKGQRYLAVYGEVSIHNLFQQLQAITGIPAPTWQVPYGLALLGAHSSQLWGLLFGHTPLATLAGVKLAHFTGSVDNTQTRQHLDLDFKDPTPTLSNLVMSMHLAMTLQA